jgi:hypothetical protein
VDPAAGAVLTAGPRAGAGPVKIPAALPPNQAPQSSPRDGLPAVRTPVVRPASGPGHLREPENARRVPPAIVAQGGRGGEHALPVVRERAARAPGPGGAPVAAWAAPAGAPAALPLAPAARGHAAGPAAPATPGSRPAAWRPPGQGTRSAAAVPAARGHNGDHGRPRSGRPRPVLAPADIDRIADKVQRKLTRRLAIEDERRGLTR